MDVPFHLILKQLWELSIIIWFYDLEKNTICSCPKLLSLDQGAIIRITAGFREHPRPLSVLNPQTPKPFPESPDVNLWASLFLNKCFHEILKRPVSFGNCCLKIITRRGEKAGPSFFWISCFSLEEQQFGNTPRLSPLLVVFLL